MFGGTLKVAAWAAAAAVTVTLASGDAFARPRGGNGGHAGFHHGAAGFHGGIDRGVGYRGYHGYHGYGIDRGVVLRRGRNDEVLRHHGLDAESLANRMAQALRLGRA